VCDSRYPNQIAQWFFVKGRRKIKKVLRGALWKEEREKWIKPGKSGKK
jgi:hypothetical protein